MFGTKKKSIGMHKMRPIGTDASIRTCRAEGYIVIYANGNHKPIDKDKPYRITQSNPDAWPSGYLVPGDTQKYLIDDDKSFNDLLEIYHGDKQAVFNYADHHNCPPNLEAPTIYDFLHLASDLCMYWGNHYFTN